MYYTKVNESFISAKILRKLLHLSNENIDIADYSLDCIVEWELQLEQKKDGINGMEIVIHSIDGDIYWMMNISDNLTEDDISNLVDNGDAELLGDDEIEGFIKVNSKIYPVDFSYNFEWSSDSSIAIYPQEINFDLVENDNIQMTVEF